MRSISWFGLLLSALLLPLCGCGGGSRPLPASVQAPSGLSYTASTADYIKGTTIAADDPTSTGGPVGVYVVSPALPAGLTLNASTGVITGTPTAVSATASYTVTATNATGSTTASLSITVNDAAPAGLSYTTGTATYTMGAMITANIPTSTGGAVTAYELSPALPAGLTMDDETGIITGTPTAAAAQANYTVMASNLTGSTTATLSITVNAAAAGVQFIPNMNQWITPLAPLGSQFSYLDTGLSVNGADWLAGQAVSTAVSPDGKTLLVLTTGYNRVFNPGGGLNPEDGTPYYWPDSGEYVFIYDISKGAPAFKQVVTIPNSYHGIAFDPSGTAFYVSSGMGDYPYTGGPYTMANYSPASAGLDSIHVFTLSIDATTWAEQSELALGHRAGIGLGVKACAAGVAISKDGQTLVVANYYNDSITVFSGGLGNWSEQGELDLRPGKNTVSPQSGVPGGEYPFGVVVTMTTNNSTQVTTKWAYVSSIRDREIDVVNLNTVGAGGGAEWPVTARIPVRGQPNKMTMNAAQTRLYVAEDQSDTIDVIDINPNDGPRLNTVLETIPITSAITPAALGQYTGANTNSVTLSPDGTQLYVTNGNLNSIALVALSGADSNDHVLGFIPTGWYPNSASLSTDGKWVYVVNGKSPTGPNPDYCYSGGKSTSPNCLASDEYNPQRIKAGLQSFPSATLAAQLPMLTAQVIANNRLSSTESPQDTQVMAAVRQAVHHVIFVIKENRTYDEVLGDLPVGNGDPTLTQFGQSITPNLHRLAQTFVTLDNLMATSEVSYDGWSWTTGARATDVVEHQYTVNYANRGLSLDFNGFDRNVNVAIPTLAGRLAADPATPNDPDVLAGQTDVSAPDGPDNEIDTGHLWDAALRAGLTVRNYGFFIDVTCYNITLRGVATSGTSPCGVPLLTNPAATNTLVAVPANAALAPYTDPYYRGFDTNFPDYYRYTEWARDFDANYANGGLPALTLVALGHDHTGTFGTAIDGVNTPETQEADNDYAVGLLIQKIAGSGYANDTLIFVIEDDAQDGADHVDSHRTIAFVAGAFVKQQSLVHTQYNTLDFVRTMEEVLGIPPMNLNDAIARPMADIFNTTPTNWTFTATPSTYLYNTTLPLPPKTAGLFVPKSTHNAKYWARVTRGLDFSDADRVDPDVYNHILWKGLMGNRPYPAPPNGRSLGPSRGKEEAQRQHFATGKTSQEPKKDRD